MMKNNPLQIIEAILIAVAAIGMTSVYQEFCQNLKSERRRKFWKIRNAERLIFAAIVLFFVLGYITASLSVILLSVLAIGSACFDAYYVNTYINTPWMNSEGNEVQDVTFFFIRPMLLQLRKDRTIELEGMKLTLIRENGYDFEISIVAMNNVVFPWQLHFGIEKFKLKKGAFKIAFDWITDTESTYTVQELQGHCFHLTLGTEMTSTITLQEKI